jgi:hypothetical protein
MRTWQKATLGVVITIIVIVAALAGTGAYFVLRHLEKTVTSEAEANKVMDAVRSRYAPRVPLVEISDPRSGDIRINREPGPAAPRVGTAHIINWKAEGSELTRTEVPLWLARFSSINILSQLGVAPERFRLTVADIERYGPGVVADYRSPGAMRILIWVD